MCIISICVRHFQSVGWHCAVRGKWMQHIIAKVGSIGSSSISSSCPVIFEISLRWLNKFAFDFRKDFFKSLMMLRSPVTSSSNMGPSWLYTGPNCWQKLLSKVTKRAGFSNRYKELCVASFSNRLAIIFNLREKSERLLFGTFRFEMNNFCLVIVFLGDFFGQILIVFFVAEVLIPLFVD